MKVFGNFLGIVFVLTLLAASGAGVYFLFKYVADLFGMLSPQLQYISVITSISAFFCAFIIAGGLKTRYHKATSSYAVVKRINIYEQMITYWCVQLKKQIDEEKALKRDIGKLEQLLALYGSPKVITAHINLLRLVTQEGICGTGVPACLLMMVQEMREDIGQSDWSLRENDLLDLLLGQHGSVAKNKVLSH